MQKQLLNPHLYNPKLASLIIRVGLAAVLLYAAIDAFREPAAWISYMPSLLTKLLAAKTMLDIASVFQIVLAFWLVWGKYLFGAALLTALLLGSIIVSSISSFLITFRDVGLLAATIALMFLDK